MSVQDPTGQNKKKLSEQPHYFQWGLTAFCVIVLSVMAVVGACVWVIDWLFAFLRGLLLGN